MKIWRTALPSLSLAMLRMDRAQVRAISKTTRRELALPPAVLVLWEQLGTRQKTSPRRRHTAGPPPLPPLGRPEVQGEVPQAHRPRYPPLQQPLSHAAASTSTLLESATKHTATPIPMLARLPARPFRVTSQRARQAVQAEQIARLSCSGRIRIIAVALAFTRTSKAKLYPVMGLSLLSGSRLPRLHPQCSRRRVSHRRRSRTRDRQPLQAQHLRLHPTIRSPQARLQ